MLWKTAPGGAVRIALERVTGIRVSAARIRTASLRSVREAPPEPRALNRVRFPSPIRMLWKTAAYRTKSVSNSGALAQVSTPFSCL